VPADIADVREGRHRRLPGLAPKTAHRIFGCAISLQPAMVMAPNSKSAAFAALRKDEFGWFASNPV
jgi:hypothetical protein